MIARGTIERTENLIRAKQETDMTDKGFASIDASDMPIIEDPKPLPVLDTSPVRATYTPTTEMDAYLYNGLKAGIGICHGRSAAAGWWIDAKTKEDARLNHHHVFTLLGLIHSEISEAFEGHRKNRQDEHLPQFKSIEVELADAVIRILDMAGGYNLDVAGAVMAKLEYNAQRADHKLENRMAEGGKSV